MHCGEMLRLSQVARDERQTRIVQMYRQTAKKEHANILRRRQIIEDRKEELEYISTQRVSRPITAFSHIDICVLTVLLPTDLLNLFHPETQH